MCADLRSELVATKTQAAVKEPPAALTEIKDEELKLFQLRQKCEKKALEVSNLTEQLAKLKQELNETKFEAKREADLAEDLRSKQNYLEQTELELGALAQGLRAREQLLADRMEDLDKN